MDALRRIGGYARIVEAIESKYIPGKINVQTLYCPVHCLTIHDGQTAQYSPTGADYSYLASYESIIAWYSTGNRNSERLDHHHLTQLLHQLNGCAHHWREIGRRA